MNETHPRETELALLSDGPANGETAQHLKWCRECRATADEYRCLQATLSDTLTVASHISPPRPSWRDIQDRLRAVQRQLVATYRLPAVAGALLFVFLALVIPSALGTGLTAYALSPQATCAPLPIVTTPDEPFTPTATPIWRGEVDQLTPPLTLHPRPSASDIATASP